VADRCETHGTARLDAFHGATDVSHADPGERGRQHGGYEHRTGELRRQRRALRSFAALPQRQDQNHAFGHSRLRPERRIDMSLSKVFEISGSAISAQSQRLNVVSSNLANAESVTGPDGKAYRARQ